MGVPDQALAGLENTEGTVLAADAEESKPRGTMSPQEALDRLRKGELIENVRIERLRLKGEFPLPVRLRGVALIQPRFDGATFQGEVIFANCTLEKPHCAQV